MKVKPWVERILDWPDPARRVLDVETAQEEDADGLQIGVVALWFRARDLRGEPYEACGKLLLPSAVLAGDGDRLPVWFSCGYELPDDIARQQVARGRIVVSSCDPRDDEVFPFHNPLCRGPNTDYVLAHLVRSLPFVDPARIIYSGGSAGGYAALLVAAEAFPAAAAVAGVPVVNLAYQAAYTMLNAPRIAADPPAEQPLMGVLMAMFVEFIERGWKRSFGDDVSTSTWFDHSPVAHVERITCPVAAFFSTADFLVPIEQVGSGLAAPTLAALPPGVVMSASALTPAPHAGIRLLDVLADAAEVQLVPVPPGVAEARISDIDLTMTRPQTPAPVRACSDKQWQVVVVDEGPTVFGIGHTRHLIEADFEPYVAQALDKGVQPDQLTSAKLQQLVQRWSGEEWLAPDFHRLDDPAAEQADVECGLRAFCALSPAHARRFADLYESLQPPLQVLPPSLVSELASLS